MKLTHSRLLILAGVIWLMVGAYLLPLGLNYLNEAAELAAKGKLTDYPLLSSLQGFISDPQTSVVVLITISLIIGYTKGKMAMGAAVRKTLERLNQAENPAPITHLFTPRYLGLIACMMALGIALSKLGVAWDVRGVIDIAVGSALVNGAMLYFRHASEAGAAASSNP